MKKRLIILILAICISGLHLFSESPHFLLQLNNEVGFCTIGINDSISPTFCLGNMPLVEVEMQIPVINNPSSKIYVGLQNLYIIPYGFMTITNCRFGYAFKKPENWKKYHLELLGNTGLGATFTFIYKPEIYPVCETGCHLYWMPEDKGFFWGFGPNVMGLMNFYTIPRTNIMFMFSCNFGYKF